MKRNKKFTEVIRRKVLERFRVEDTSTEQQNEFLEEMLIAVSERVLVDIYEGLSKENRIIFLEKVKAIETSDEFNNFLQEKVPNYEDTIVKVVAELETALQAK